MAKEQSLDRRSFIETAAAGSAAGAVLVGASGCGGFLRRGESGEVTIDRRALSSHLEHLDAGLESIRGTRPISRAVETADDPGEPWGGSRQEVDAFIDRGDELARKSLRSLLLAGAVMDLPDEARELPEIRSRVEAMSDEMDEAVFESTALLATCPASEQRAIQDALRNDPDLVMRVAEVVDERGSTRGLGRTGRRRLREISTHISGRLRRQPPSMLFDECVETVERVVERYGVGVTMERWLASEAVAQAFWGETPGDGEHKENKGPEVGEQGADRSAQDGGSDSSAGSDSTVDQHIQALGEPDVARRVAAAQALGAARSAEAIPALSRALRSDASPEMRGWVLRALHQIGTPEARRAMTVAREDSDERIRQLESELSAPSNVSAPDSGGREVQTPGAAEHIAMLSDPDANQRVQAARRLGELRAEEAVVPLARRLSEDERPEVRGWCLRALSQIGTEDAVSAMMLARRDPDSRVSALAQELTAGRTGAARYVAPVDLSEARSSRSREEAVTQASGRGRRVMIAGAGVAGAGAVILAIGGIVLGTGGLGGAYAMTAGGVILVVGLVVLIVGGAIRAQARRRRQATRYGDL